MNSLCYCVEDTSPAFKSTRLWSKSGFVPVCVLALNLTLSCFGASNSWSKPTKPLYNLGKIMLNGLSLLYLSDYLLLSPCLSLFEKLPYSLFSLSLVAISDLDDFLRMLLGVCVCISPELLNE